MKPTSSNSNQQHRAFPGPENILRQQLSNGIVALCRANAGSGSVVIAGSLLAGGLFDSDEKLGLADFTATALMRGTQSRSFLEIYDALESIGASLGFSCGTHTVSFSGRALVEDLELLLELAAQALRQPIFPEDQIERLRAQLLTSLAIQAQSTAERASQAFDELVYPDHPYRRPSDGFPETIQVIHRQDLAEFQRRHYGPKGMILTVVGGLEPLQALEQAERVFGDWQNPIQPQPPDLPSLNPLTATTTRHVTLAGKSQSDLVMGVAGPSRAAPDFLAASLGNHVLGRFGMMGRLGEVVREQAGLAYYVSSNLSGGLGPGPWDVSAGIDPANLERAIDLILAELRRFVTEPIEAAELADSQANYIGRLPISLESNAGVAGALLSLERYQLGLDYYQRFPDLVNQVTPDQVLEAAQRYLDPERLAIATAGL